MHDKHIIFGVHITDRVKNAPDIQRILTQYGCNIKTRIGLHHVADNQCSPRGLILLEMHGDEQICRELFDALARHEGVQVKEMVFDHPA